MFSAIFAMDNRLVWNPGLLSLIILSPQNLVIWSLGAESPKEWEINAS